MDLSRIAHLRLVNQRLLGPHFERPEEVVDWMAAIQAQDYPGAKWSVGLRLKNSTDGQVEEAIENRKIVRSWVMRGTLHFVAAADLSWLLGLLAPGIIAGNQRRYRELGLDEATLHRSDAILEKALQKSASLSRKELLGLLKENGISTEGQRGVYLLQRASLDGLICQGTVRGNQANFLSLDGLPARRTSREEALAELARRYYESRGPATWQDFGWWSGIPAAEAKAATESIQGELQKEIEEGKIYLWSVKGPAAAGKKQPVFLLPGFDEFLIPYKDRTASLGVATFTQIAPTGGILPGTIAIDGRIRGTWKRTFKKDSVIVAIKGFDRFSQEEEADISAAIHGFGKYLGQKALREGE